MESMQREHLVWRYFSMKLQEERQESVSAELFSEWVTAYREEKSLVLEAVIVDMIKRSRLDAVQLERVKETCSSQEVQKQLFLHQMRLTIHSPSLLTREEVGALMEARGYELLKEALRRSAVSESAYDVFSPPQVGVRDRKHLEELYRLAQEKVQNKAT